ncbi:hypothetical protein [Bradyrhizobium sp. BTAi1]|uniref:hypothetical protein n=1 Tax=Bradyrhizobium sp. (strain BTAi1 / ATCC BAA-1182) TaxID=288000 RepID=UPI0001519406|nr:hypothetical protein [Bradyrhizobium sp. BTAi1]ABQ32861.1 hypothetical protein BBta_0584 [Bradyrhizobium sp. BTAi1]
MGRYLEILKRAEAEIALRDKSAQRERSLPSGVRGADFGRFRRFGRSSSELANALATLERRCPDWVALKDWQQATTDGRRFVAHWGDQALRLKWSVQDLFGLHEAPKQPGPNYCRLSRYDQAGLIWLLGGRPVVALTDVAAAIDHGKGVVTIHRKIHKPTV